MTFSCTNGCAAKVAHPRAYFPDEELYQKKQNKVGGQKIHRMIDCIGFHLFSDVYEDRVMRRGEDMAKMLEMV